MGIFEVMEGALDKNACASFEHAVTIREGKRKRKDRKALERTGIWMNERGERIDAFANPLSE